MPTNRPAGRRGKGAGSANRYKPVRAWMVNRGEIDVELICRTRDLADGFDQLECGPIPVIIADARYFKVVPKPTPSTRKKARKGRGARG